MWPACPYGPVHDTPHACSDAVQALRENRAYLETEEILSSLFRALILLMSYRLVVHLKSLSQGHGTGRRLVFSR
ncbi:hypothetical protein MRX96_014359 [Rhipicephalus microplus]